MNKGLKALETIKTLYGINGIVVSSDMELAQEKCREIEKELKDGEKNKRALEIIKNKILDSEDYLKIIANNCGITKEEYQLLQEILLWTYLSKY